MRQASRQALQRLGIGCFDSVAAPVFVSSLQGRHISSLVDQQRGLSWFHPLSTSDTASRHANSRQLSTSSAAASAAAADDKPLFNKILIANRGEIAIRVMRTAKRLGACVDAIVYRRGKKELPARVEEVHHAEEEGIRFDFLVAPLEVIGNEQGWVTGLKCIRMELGEPDDSGRRRPVQIPGSEFVLPCDIVIVAIGTKANPLLTGSAPELKLNKWGNIEANEDGATSIPGVYAGGDIVRGAATVILAMGDGKRAARAVDGYLRGA